MSGRVRIRELGAAQPPADAVADLAASGCGDEPSLRAAFVRELEAARSRGCRSLDVPVPEAGVSLRRSAEILLGEARRHLAAGTCVEEIRFLLRGEPALRVFESVDDAARIAEQAKRWT